ncbi:MAG: hypothetical protein GY810_32375 [Aureispira sp.]|nr:hypothetical protein [Aureispira sp.]
MDYKIIVRHFRRLASGETDPESTMLGICGEICNVPYCTSGIYDYCIGVMLGHPEYSGDKNYPIPHPSMDSYNAFYDIKDLWDIETEYGRTRREWCGYIADKLEKKYAKQS